MESREQPGDPYTGGSASRGRRHRPDRGSGGEPGAHREEGAGRALPGRAGPDDRPGGAGERRASRDRGSRGVRTGRAPPARGRDAGVEAPHQPSTGDRRDRARRDACAERGGDRRDGCGAEVGQRRGAADRPDRARGARVPRAASRRRGGHGGRVDAAPCPRLPPAARPPRPLGVYRAHLRRGRVGSRLLDHRLGRIRLRGDAEGNRDLDEQQPRRTGAHGPRIPRLPTRHPASLEHGTDRGPVPRRGRALARNPGCGPHHERTLPDDRQPDRLPDAARGCRRASPCACRAEGRGRPGGLRTRGAGRVDRAPVREFEELHMFFGGVGAALFSPRAGFTLASDPRRDGGTATGGRSR